MTDAILGAATGFFIGAGYALAGYAGAYRQNPKTVFSLSNFGGTFIVGALAGAVLGFQGVTFGPDVVGNFTTLAGNFGVIYTIKTLAKILFKL